MSTEANPARIGRYEIQKPLGSGAMGDVFLARDPNIDRLVAIKTVRVIGGNDEDIADRRGRLLREARAAGKFQHPHVVALYDAGEANGLLYLAFEYVPGQDLLKRARQTPEMSLREVLRVVRETASALDYAQQQNVVHRDIKPSNILLGPRGVAKVADFGIAKLHDQSVELTRTGSVVGSPQYMSPEQIRGEALDGRSDLFSLGVVLYELLSRTRPFGGDTISTLVFEILAKEPPPIESLRPGLSPALVQLVRSMMVKDRNLRVADAGQVVEAIYTLERSIPAAELDSPASQASGPDGLPTQLMPSGSAPASPSPYPSGPHTPLPFASSTPSAQLGSVPMGAPLPSGPLAALPPAAYGGAPSGPPSAPPSGQAAWNAPPPPPAMTPPPMAAPPMQPPRMAPPPMGPPAHPPGTQAPGMHPPGMHPPGMYPPGGHPAGTHPPGMYPPPGMQQLPAAPPYGSQPPRPGYPTAKPTSPLKLVLILGFFGLFGLAGAFLLVIFFGDSSDTPPASTASTTTAQEAPPPPVVDSNGETPAATATIGDGTNSSEYVDPSEGTVQPDAEAAPEPAWTEPRPTTTASDAPAEDSVPVPVAPPRRTPTTQGGGNADGGALARLGEAIGGDKAENGDAGSEDSGEAEDSGTEDGGDVETSPSPRRPRPEPVPESGPWDQAAAGARSEMETGLRFQFKVTPPEAKVLFWPRGDRRAIVQGSASDFDPKKDEEARVLELPGDGEYLLVLRHGDYPDHVIRVHADRSRGERPKLLQFSLGRGGSGGAVSSVRVSRAVSFAGTPGDAYVFVDGRASGRASDYPGGEKRSGQNLKLDRGKHVVRLEARGFKPFEIRVEVGSGAPPVEQITFRLEKE